MTLERTKDYRRVKNITDQNPIDEQVEWQLVISSRYIYLVENDGEKDVGVWCFEPYEGRYLMHTAMTKDCRGKKAIDSGLNAIGWLFENSEVDAILAPVPKRLRHAQIIPRRGGLKVHHEDDRIRTYIMTRDMYRDKQERLN